MTGNCETLELTDGLGKIKASLSSGAQSSGVSITYKHYSNELIKTYGEIDSEGKTTWHFTDDQPLVGLYGRQTETGIAQLGFITLDTAC
jgi:hypothetical protein